MGARSAALGRAVCDCQPGDPCRGHLHRSLGESFSEIGGIHSAVLFYRIAGSSGRQLGIRSHPSDTASPAVLAVIIVLRWIGHFEAPWRDVGYTVGWLSVLVGLGGVLYHLESRFFLDRTLKSLTYAAPFAAPLAYAGLGFLLLMNRMVAARSAEWARWVIFMSLGGFFGNFVLSLTDHASNGFFAKTEWIPVISSALATGFLIVPLVLTVTRRFMDVCLIVMLTQALVGVLGFWFHIQANLVEPGNSLFDRLVNGAPPIAPLLFPNLVGLALIGIWALLPHLDEATPGQSWSGATYDWARTGEEPGAGS